MTLIRRYKLKKRLYLISFVYYMFGFLLWNLDNKFCSYLQHYRAQVERLLHIDQTAPEWQKILLNCVVVTLKSISEFHSLWHIFTGYAAFMTILFLIEVNFKHFSLVNDGKTKYKSHEKPIESKLCSMYYHLSNSLIEINTGESESARPKRANNNNSSKLTTKKYY